MAWRNQHRRTTSVRELWPWQPGCKRLLLQPGPQRDSASSADVVSAEGQVPQSDIDFERLSKCHSASSAAVALERLPRGLRKIRGP